MNGSPKPSTVAANVDGPESSGFGHLGDRLAGFTVCLPAEPVGEVVVIAPRAISAAVTLRFPRAHLLAHNLTESIPAPGSVGLLVIDRTFAVGEDLVAALRPLLAPDAVVASIAGSGELAVYPSLNNPENVWRRGWPYPPSSTSWAQLRRRAGLMSASRRGTPFISFSGPDFESLADRLAADLSLLVGANLTLAGVLTAGDTILRLTGAGVPDIAVRLAFSGLPNDVVIGDRLRTHAPRLGDVTPDEVARGTTCGHQWVATRWVPSRRATLLETWRRRSVVQETIRAAIAELSERPTGYTADGWSSRWLERADLVPVSARPRLAESLAPLDRGLPTGWCHGDLWRGNILVDGSRGVVIDWDNACDDAPLGLDHLLVTAMDLERKSDDLSMAQAVVGLVDDEELKFSVAGTEWADWDRETRVALVVAAYLLYLRNRSMHDLGAPSLNEAVATLLEQIEPVTPDNVTTDSAPADKQGSVQGAGWLGLGAGIVKTSQTVVLLVLAALLAPSALGILAIGALVLNVTSAITDLGASTALVYWRGNAERAARSALTLALAFSVVLTSMMWLLAPLLSNALNAGDEGTGVIRGLMLCLPFLAVAGVSQELLRRALLFKRRVMPDIAGALGGTVVAIVLASNGHGVYSLVIGQLVQAVLVMSLCWVAYPPVRPGWSQRDAAGLISYGGHLAGANLLQLLMLNLDYLIVARVLGTHPLGVYSMAFRLAYMPYLLIAVVICGAAFAHLCRLRGAELGSAVAEVGVTLLTLVLPLYLGIMLLAPHLELLGAKWAPGVHALRWLAVYGLILSMVQLMLVTLNSISRTRDTMLLNLLHVALLAALLGWWARFGVTMVAVAQVVAALVMLGVALAILRRNVTGMTLRPHAGRLAMIGLGAAAMVTTAISLQSAFPASRGSVWGLLLVGSLSLAAYLVPVMLRRETLDSLRSLTRRDS